MSETNGDKLSNSGEGSPLEPRLLRFLAALADSPLGWRLATPFIVTPIAFALRYYLEPHLGGNAMFVTFYPAIMVSAIVGGLSGGFTAILLSVLFAHARLKGFQIAPFDRTSDEYLEAAFIFNALLIVAFGKMLQVVARTRLESLEIARLNAEQLGHFVEQAPAAMAMFDRDMRYLAASARWREGFGLSSDLVGKSHYEVLPEVAEEWKEAHRRALEGEVLRSEQDEVRRRDGTTQWLRREVRPWRRAPGAIDGVVIFSEDITERVKARAALAESDERLRFALRAANAGVWEWDLASNRSIWSDDLWRLFGLAPNSCKPSFEAWLSAVHPGDRAAVAQAVTEAAVAGRETLVEWRVFDPSGPARWLMTRAGLMPRNESAPARYMGVVIDITERKRAEQALRENEKRLSTIFNSTMESIVAFDRSGVIQSANPAARALFGYSNDEILGQNIAALAPDFHRAEQSGAVDDYLHAGEKKIIGRARRVEGRRKDGALFPLELTVTEAILNDERIFVGFIRDLSAIEAERRRVDDLRQELFHVSRVNDMGEVVASLAHDVGQPVAAILNFAAAHRRGFALKGAPTEPELVFKIEAQARRAADILRRLRGFIEKRPPEREPENIEELVDDAIELAFLRSRARVVRSPLAGDDVRVNVDRVQVGQVLVNLLRNADDALVDAEEPEIVVKTGSDGPGMIRISVADNGSGVDPEAAKELFGAFYSTKQFGMGLGLSLSKSIVEDHGGAIFYRANAPHGSIFEFTLPIYRDGDGDAGTS